LLLAAVVVIGAVGLYLSQRAPVHEPQPMPAAETSPAPAKPAGALSQEQLQRMVEQSQAQVKGNPKDASAWAMLAHSYDMLGRFDESSKAYARLAELLPRDAQVLADYADALAVAQGRSLQGQPAALIDKALALDPKNSKALALAGTAAFERHDAAAALRYWERARASSTDPVFAQQIDSSIADARAMLDGSVGAASAPVAATAAAVAGGGSISGHVSLSASLRAQAPPEATVYVFARPANGSRMPVAILRRQVRELPLDFTLDDSMAMVPGNTLSKAGEVVIVARVSRRGDVTPQAGDLQGSSTAVAAGARGVNVEIGEVLK
jgi:cytochrome c-type biogenesis protein CcmH